MKVEKTFYVSNSDIYEIKRENSIKTTAQLYKTTHEATPNKITISWEEPDKKYPTL